MDQRGGQTWKNMTQKYKFIFLIKDSVLPYFFFQYIVKYVF